MRPDRRPIAATLLEVDPLPDAAGFLARAIAAQGARYRLRRLGGTGLLDLHLDGWLEPVIGARGWGTPASFADDCARAFAGCASPRILCVRGDPLEPALLERFAPDVIMAEDRAIPAGFRVIASPDGIALAIAVASERAERQWLDLWAAHAAQSAARRAMARLDLAADSLLVWDGLAGASFDGWVPLLRLAAGRPLRLILPAIGSGAMRIRLVLGDGWAGSLIARLDDAPIALQARGNSRHGQSRECLSGARHGLLSLDIDPRTDPALAAIGASVRQIELEAA